MNFNFDFGPCTHDGLRVSMYGIAVKNSDGTYVSYNKQTKDIVNVDILNFDGGKYLYKIPVAIKDIKVGDVILHNDKNPVIVVGVSADIIAVDVVNGEKKIILPVKSPFGFDYCSKIVSLFDMNGGFNATNDNPFGNILPFMMLAGDGKRGDSKDMLLAMMMMNGGKVDFVSNPMMLYLLMVDGGSKDIDPFMLMMMTGAMGAVPSVSDTVKSATCHSNAVGASCGGCCETCGGREATTPDSIVKLPE